MLATKYISRNMNEKVLSHHSDLIEKRNLRNEIYHEICSEKASSKRTKCMRQNMSRNVYK